MITEHSTTIQSFNPATRELLGEVPVMGAEAVEHAVRKAWAAYDLWRLTEYHQRARKILKLKKVIVKRSDEIAALITREVGKPMVESLLAELTGPLDACEWFADNTERALKDQMVNMTNPLLYTKQSVIAFDPIGVVGIIAPWNYPFAIPVMSIVMSLMVGNTVVLKPSEKSPLTGIKIGELFQEAGFPEAVVTVVTGDRTTGAHLSRSKLAKLIFTGSVEGGRKVMAQASDNLIPVTLELGGKDPAIVLPDAPVDWTARGLVWSAFTNCGQACASIERVYVVKSKRSDKLIERLVAHTKELKVGGGLDMSVDVGPLIDETQLEKVARQVDEAVAQGATVLCGGKRREDLDGYFYEPTILTNVTQSMSVMKEETFGPVLPVMLVKSEDEAVVLANQSNYGLCASVWSRNLGRAEDVARDLEAGTIFINDALFSFACPQVPWGGLKMSGYGRTHSYFGLLDLVNVKHITIDAAGGANRLWWYPYGKSRVNVARGGLRFLHGSFPFGKISGAVRFLYNSMLKAKPDEKKH